MGNNVDLKKLYEEWYCKVLANNKDVEHFTYPYFLPVDINSIEKCKIMIIAKESNESAYTDLTCMGKPEYDDFQSVFDYMTKKYNCYRKDASAHDTVANFCKYIANNSCYSTEEIVVNNLNKISISGKNTPVFKYKKHTIPGQFEHVENYYSIIEAEIAKYRPEIVLLACGSSYRSHIENAFKFNNGNNELDSSITINRSGKHYTAIPINDMNLNNYGVKMVIWCFHPQALNCDDRKAIVSEISGMKL